MVELGFGQRRSGRTQKMIEAASEIIQKGGRVLVLAANERNAADLRRRFYELPQQRSLEIVVVTKPEKTRGLAFDRVFLDNHAAETGSFDDLSYFGYAPPNYYETVNWVWHNLDENLAKQLDLAVRDHAIGTGIAGKKWP